MMKYTLILFLMVMISACRDTQQHKQSQMDSTRLLEAVVDTNVVVPHVESGQPWRGALMSLRKALMAKDVKETAAYFSFPLNLDSTSAWTPIEPTEEELNAWKASTKDTLNFSRQDFEKYYSRFFLPELRMGLKSLTPDARFEDEAWASPEFDKAGRPFQLHLHFDKDSQTLNLNVAFLGGKDEEGNYVSEGEYSIIYVYHWTGKRLIFDRMVVAG